jgi:hypothetical protein
MVRPVRLAVAAAISPKFESLVTAIEDRLSVSKTVAVTITVLVANLFGTLFFMSAGIALASVCSGVPIWATRK